MLQRKSFFLQVCLEMFWMEETDDFSNYGHDSLSARLSKVLHSNTEITVAPLCFHRGGFHFVFQ